MPYYKFGQNDIFNNNVETHPKCEFLIHDRKIYYNGYVSEPSSYSSESGETNPYVKHLPSGYLSLYEINIDRQKSLHGGTVSPTLAYQFITKDSNLGSFKTVSSSDFSSSLYGDVLTGSYPMSSSLSIERYVADTDLQWTDCGKTRPRLTALKNTLNYYKTLSPKYDFDANFGEDKDVNLISVPSIFFGSSIEKGTVSLKYYITGSLAAELQDTKRNGELIQVFGSGSETSISSAGTGSITLLTNGPQLAIYFATATIVTTDGTTIVATASQTTTTSTDINNPTFKAWLDITIEDIRDNLLACLNANSKLIATDGGDNGSGGYIVTITQADAGVAGDTAITFGDAMGGLDLSTHWTKTDFTGGTDNGKVAGVVLYNEGFIALTGDWSLDSNTSERYNWCPDSSAEQSQCDNPKWIYWGQLGDPEDVVANDLPLGSPVDTSDCLSSNVPYSSFDLSFNGTSYIPTVTMLAHAKKGELNNSNNPTFLTYGQDNAIISKTGSLYSENSELTIKNTTKSPYDGYDAAFQKQTWISQIGVYDEDKNLIAIAKLANPVRKTEDRDFTFKLKLDI